ncbi:MAG: hypothetical protein MK008_10950 [Bdellovibrionales bacterium]|nr:hypothetical protein [Bdellovibrionales bacterium]
MINMLILILISTLSFAELDSSSTKALEKTKTLLQNQEARQKAAQQTPEAQKAYNKAKSLMGSQQGTDALFGLSSEVFEHIVKSTNGDSKKMNELLQKAATDPEAFANSLPPHLKQKIKAVSKKVPKSNSPN